MSSSRSLTSIDVSEYDRIEAAMSESERGRWFLQEYISRNRAHDTGILLDAIGRLESAVTGDRDGGQIGRLRGDVMDMAHAIARTKAEIAAIHAPDHDQSRLGGASAALDAIVLSTERATSDILGAAEQVQEAAWTLRESGSDAAICDELDRRATAIYTACSFQDLNGQRTARIIHTLRYLEDRLAAMMAIWGDDLDTVPAPPGSARSVVVPVDLCQSDVDRYIDMDASSAAPIPPADRMPAGDMVADDVVFRAVATPGTAPAPEPVTEVEGEAALSSEPDMVEPDTVAPDMDEPATAIVMAHPQVETFEESPSDDADDAVTPEAGTPVDAVAQAMASAAEPIDPPEQTDIASAFAEIDALSEEERRALFS